MELSKLLTLAAQSKEINNLLKAEIEALSGELITDVETTVYVQMNGWEMPFTISKALEDFEKHGRLVYRDPEGDSEDTFDL
ncbi:hypothetical protein [Olivibacter jilunii]|uniref:hypothetical protein n=1 Tax=Olivibacter jilunii TaxID=985016 RepID=UPI00102FCBDF|nr:hypothetical protein [Olivibacter jilunii]